MFYLKQSPKFLEISNALCYIEYKERHPLEQMPFSSDSIPKVDAPKYAFCSYEHSLTCLPTGKAFLFFLIILSRKVRNAIIKLPKDINKANIPMEIVMIS